MKVWPVDESQSLSGFGWCFYKRFLQERKVETAGLNPFQGLVGVSTMIPAVIRKT